MTGANPGDLVHSTFFKQNDMNNVNVRQCSQEKKYSPFIPDMVVMMMSLI